MRAALMLVAVGGALAGCRPEIYSGAYECGPEMLCPPEQVCSPATEACVAPDLVEPFACAGTPPGYEPDDAVADAPTFSLGCDLVVRGWGGCLPTADDVDLAVVELAPACVGATVEVDAHFALAFAEPVLSVTTLDGEPLAPAPCAPDPASGSVASSCVGVVASAAQILVAMSVPRDGTCDGACAFNRYDINVAATPP
ncbi:MAG: hypothetical protein R2939_21290 [Kofleriaceae bacterium]